LCFNIEAPWRAFVPEPEFAARVELTRDLCVVDGQHFFIRGHILIPILDYTEQFIFSVWSSLSEKSFVHVNERWNDESRDKDPPYFGWLCSPIPVYVDTLHLKISVQSQKVGFVPHFTLEPTSHPLSVDQRNGISLGRAHEISHALLHQIVERSPTVLIGSPGAGAPVDQRPDLSGPYG
jgi:hypothetical protein